MEKYKTFVKSRLWLCLFFLTVPLLVFAQQSRKVSGVVTDELNEPIIGVVVSVPGTTLGMTTDLDGRYSLDLPNDKNQIEFFFLGYESQQITITGSNVINVQLVPKDMALRDVVVIGYGTQRKGDLTGSISNVSSKDFNSGLISSPEQLINGKVSGVQIMSNSGSPTGGSTIRIRGGASLNASNDPLIVLDGLPLESGGISGNTGNFLSLINPSDIESMTILKDASSTAIYGSRASNGVILITTKRGTGSGIKVSVNSTNSIQTRTKTADMLGRDQFVNLVNSRGTQEQKGLLQSYSTNWNDEIYHTAFGTDNNVSVSGRIAPDWPVRASFGYYNQDGIVRTDNAERFTGNLSLNPSFFNDHLKVTLNAKGSVNNNTFANTGAIWAAATFNPTLPVYSGNDSFGGYYEDIDVNSGNPVNGAVRNPRGMIDQYNSTSKVERFIGNADVDYKMHFLPELKFHATLGYDYAKGEGEIYIPAEAAEYYTTSGRNYSYGPQKNSNRLLTTYFNYTKDLS
ncbi:MAG: SusC/RagA family TonB-linked outer membrane protein, partial [Prevotella sp.]|nr:SusC/RagA family TonB-linked outer membrane protein [Prevotella sp.]